MRVCMGKNPDPLGLTWLSPGARPESQTAESREVQVGQSSTNTDDVTASCAPGCRVMPGQARLSAGLSGDSEKEIPLTLMPCRLSEPTEAMTSGESGCSTMEPPARLARSVSDWESGKSRPDISNVPVTIQTIELAAVLLVQASLLFSRSERVCGCSQCANLKASTTT